MLDDTVPVRPVGPAGGFPGIRDNRGAELKYLGDQAGR